MSEFESLFDQRYFGVAVWDWMIAGFTAAVVLAGLLVLRRIVRSHYRRVQATPQVELMELPLEVASRTTLAFLILVALFAGLETVQLPAAAARVIRTIFMIAVFWQAGLWATTAVFAAIERRRARTASVDRAAVSSLGVIGFLARTTIWSFVLLLTLDNMGVEIRPLLAGLGIGGIAVALAAQNILGDLFASLSIALDKPFVVGDALTVDGFTGVVEYIGVKSTRLRSITGEQIVMTNSNLLGSRIRNHTRLTERRVVLNLSVAPDATREQLARIPALLRSIIESQADTRFERAHFVKVGPTSFDFEAAYTVTTPDYTRHMDIQQAIHFALMEALEAERLAFGYPPHQAAMQARLAAGAQRSH